MRASRAAAIWIFALCSLAGTVYFVRQPVATFRGGVFLDAEQYARMASGDSDRLPAAVAPFSYRVALPWLVSRLSPSDVVRGFRIANFVFGLLTLAAFVALLAHLFEEPWVIAVASVFFTANVHGVFRFHAFYPIATDPPMYFFTTLYLLLIVRRVDASWSGVALLSLLGFLGVLFRETVLLAPAAAFAVDVLRRSGINGRPPLTRRVVPLAAAAAALVATHAIVDARGGYTYAGQVARMMWSRWSDPLAFLMTPFAVFGPILLLPAIYAGTAVADFSRRLPILPLYGLGLLVAALLGGHHGVRLAFGTSIAVLPLVGVAMARLVRTTPRAYWLCVLVPLLVAQALASGALAAVPDFTGSPAPTLPETYALFPYGRGAHYAHLPPKLMSADLRARVVLQYGLITAYLLALRMYGAKRGWLRRREPIPIVLGREAPDRWMGEHGASLTEDRGRTLPQRASLIDANADGYNSSMGEAAQRPSMRAEALYDLPDDGHRYELVAGLLVRMPPAGARHGAIAARIARLLDEYAEKHDSGRVCTADTGFILQRSPDIVRAPDVAFVAKARIPPSGEPAQFWPFAPDLAVEIVSPSDRVDELQERLREYFAAGTRLVWVVMPGTRSVHVHRSMRDIRPFGESDRLEGEAILPGFACPVRRLFD